METNQDLLGFLTSKLDEWREYRDNNYEEKWNEYYRLWRGIWQDQDKTRGSERSRLINPALQQAIESTTAEIEEAVFGKGDWFDIADDVADEDKTDAMYVRNILREDLNLARTKEALSELIFNGTLYGTGIGEMTIEPYKEDILVEVPQPGTIDVVNREVVSKDSFLVKLRAVSPNRFLIDPVATNIEEAFGCAVVDYVSIHKIKEGQKRGYYKDVDVGDTPEREDVFAKGEQSYRAQGKVKLTTYYGLVPYGLLKEKDEEVEELFPEEEVGEEDEEDYVEAIVIIANDSAILKAVENPYFGKDRPLIAYQHEKVPNRFWGRGVAEKGYNPQKALDAELRARIDALALSTHPMMGVDASRLPRGMKFEVSPGKSILTNGNPAEILMPISFQTVNQSSFVQSSDLERQIQIATGAMDSAAPLSINARNATASGMSMMQGASIKRTKRTLMTFQEKIVIPLVNKALWRYIQLRPDRYPLKDYKFMPVGTLGIMAREYEQQLLIQLISITPPDSPVYPIIAKGIIDNSSISNREELMAALQQAQQPDPQKQQMEMIGFQTQMEKTKAETAYLNGQLEGIKIKAEIDAVKLATEQLDKQQVKDTSNPELELKAQQVIIDAQQGQEKLALESRKADQSYDIQIKQIQLEAEKVLMEKQKLAMEMAESEDDTEIRELSEIKQMVETLTQYAMAKKKPVRDSEGNLVAVDIEGFGQKKVTLDSNNMIKEIE